MKIKLNTGLLKSGCSHLRLSTEHQWTEKDIIEEELKLDEILNEKIFLKHPNNNVNNIARVHLLNTNVSTLVRRWMNRNSFDYTLIANIGTNGHYKQSNVALDYNSSSADNNDGKHITAIEIVDTVIDKMIENINDDTSVKFLENLVKRINKFINDNKKMLVELNDVDSKIKETQSNL